MPYQPPDVPSPAQLRRVERSPVHALGARRRRRHVLRTYGSDRRAQARQLPPHPLSAAASQHRRAQNPEETPRTRTRPTRTTKAQILAAVRAAYPDQKIGRNDPRVRAAIRNEAHRALYIEDET